MNNNYVKLVCRKAMQGSAFEKIIGLRSGISGMVYSHCELFWPQTGRAFVVSSTDGVGWKTRTYDASWDMYTIPIDEDESRRLELICDELLESKPVYDWPGIVRIGTLHLMGQQLPKWWFCSEQCAWALQQLGYREVLPLDPDRYSPSLLAYSVLVWIRMPEDVKQILSSRARQRRT